MCTVVFMLLFDAHQPMVPNVIDITCKNENFLTDRKTHHETTSKMNVEGATPSNSRVESFIKTPTKDHGNCTSVPRLGGWVQNLRSLSDLMDVGGLTGRWR